MTINEASRSSRPRSPFSLTAFQATIVLSVGAFLWGFGTDAAPKWIGIALVTPALIGLALIAARARSTRPFWLVYLGMFAVVCFYVWDRTNIGVLFWAGAWSVATWIWWFRSRRLRAVFASPAK